MRHPMVLLGAIQRGRGAQTSVGNSSWASFWIQGLKGTPLFVGSPWRPYLEGACFTNQMEGAQFSSGHWAGVGHGSVFLDGAPFRRGVEGNRETTAIFGGAPQKRHTHVLSWRHA